MSSTNSFIEEGIVTALVDRVGGQGNNNVFDIELKTQRWLEELGLRFDPFYHLDAGADPQLPSYLVRHEDFDKLWGDWPSFLFAPAGGGKTAFRVRLARACRSRQGGRRVFPLLFFLPRPETLDTPPTEEEYIDVLLSRAAMALLLELAYWPADFLDRSPAIQTKTAQFLARHLPAPLDYYLDQLYEDGSLTPIAQAVDPTAVGLPHEPLAERIRDFCAALNDVASQLPPSDDYIQLEQMISLLRHDLGYEAVYLLIDGVDAYIQEPVVALRLLEPVLSQTRDWQSQSLFIKGFFPVELYPLMERHQSLLTQESKIVIIKWTDSGLIQLVRERLRVASEGMFNSLTAISTPDVEGKIEDRLAAAVDPELPREIIRLVERVFYEHVKRQKQQSKQPQGRLEQKDFDSALEWYPGP
jgi:hypothetical protein